MEKVVNFLNSHQTIVFIVAILLFVFIFKGSILKESFEDDSGVEDLQKLYKHLSALNEYVLFVIKDPSRPNKFSSLQYAPHSDPVLIDLWNRIHIIQQIGTQLNQFENKNPFIYNSNKESFENNIIGNNSVTEQNDLGKDNYLLDLHKNIRNLERIARVLVAQNNDYAGGHKYNVQKERHILEQIQIEINLLKDIINNYLEEKINTYPKPYSVYSSNPIIGLPSITNQYHIHHDPFNKVIP